MKSKYVHFLPVLSFLATPASMLLYHYQQTRQTASLRNLTADPNASNFKKFNATVSSLLAASFNEPAPADLSSLDRILGIKPPRFTHD